MTEQNKTPVAEAVEQAIKPEVAPVDALAAVRQAMAANFIQHCVNAAVADNSKTPLEDGCITALTELLIVLLNQSEKGVVTENQAGRNLPLVANALTQIGMGENTLSEQLMMMWAVAAGQRGQLNTLLGKLRDASEGDYKAFLMNNLQTLDQRLPALTPAPEVVAPVESEAKSDAESLPAEDEHTPVSMDDEPSEA